MRLKKRKQLTDVLLIVTFCAFAINGYGQAFQLNGRTKNSNGKWIYLYYPDQNNHRNVDSTVINDNEFHFTGTVDGPSMVFMGLKEGNGRLGTDNSYRFFLEPGSISVHQLGQHLKNSQVEGSKTQRQYQWLVDKEEKLDQRWKVVMDTLNQVNKRSNTEYQRLKDWVLTPYTAEREGLELSFFKENPQSAATAYLLLFYVSRMAVDTLQKYYDGLGPKLQASVYGKELASEIALIRKGSPGSMAANFETNELNGEPLQLSKFKGKHVLLDFWASWCVPCRASNPHLKELYQKYHQKGLEIIGVSDDDGATAKWKAAVAKDGIGIWHNVLRGYDRSLQPGAKNPNDISQKFGIHSLPTKILIDESGKIIGRFTGTEEESLLDEALRKAFEPS